MESRDVGVPSKSSSLSSPGKPSENEEEEGLEKDRLPELLMSKIAWDELLSIYGKKRSRDYRVNKDSF